MLARHLPDLQEGFGAVLRLRGMMAVPAEPTGGLPAARRAARRRVPRPRTSPTAPAPSPCATSTSPSRPVTPARSSAAPARASPPWPRCSPGRSSRRAARSSSAASTCATSTSSSCASAVGVVTQRTEVLAGSLADNITLFGDAPRAQVEAAVAELGLTDWVAGLPEGLDTMLGPGGTSLSAGEEQLVAFARLLVRDVSVVVLDEATARMDPVTEARVVRAADRLISGRTGILVAHRLSTTERAEQVAVLESGRVVQQGPRAPPRGRGRPVPPPARRRRPRGGRRGAPPRRLLDRVGPPQHDAARRRHVDRARSEPGPPGAGTPSGIQPAVGPARRRPVPPRLAHRGLRRGHRLRLGPHRHRPAGAASAPACWSSPSSRR